MGFQVSSLCKLPGNRIKYYIHVIDASKDNYHSEWIKENFSRIAEDLGSEAAIVRGSDSLRDEILCFLERELKAGCYDVEALFHDVTSLLISEGDLITTVRPVYLIPLCFPKDNKKEQVPVSALFDKVVEATQSDNFKQRLQELHGDKLDLKPINLGVISKMIGTLNKYVKCRVSLPFVEIEVDAMVRDVIEAGNRREIDDP